MSASSAALIVTFWNVPKLAGVKVNVPPAATVKSASPDSLVTVTVTLAGGGDSNLTPNCAVLFSITASVLTRFVWIRIGTSLSISIAVTSAEVRLVPEARMTAVPFAMSPSSAALIVTFWNAPKLAGVKVSVAPPLTVRSVSPDTRATFTVTLLAGADANLTPNWAEPDSLTFSVVTLVWIGIGGGGSLSDSFAVTSAEARPVPEARMIAEPFVESASSAALIVTFWNVPKLVGVKVKVAPPLTDKSVSPDTRATLTMTLPAGAADNLTPNCALPPSFTVNVVTLVWIAIGGGGSLSTSFAVSSIGGRPVREARMTAEPFAESASSAALIVTFWNVPKLVGVKVKVAPPVTDRSVSPEFRATFTVTLLAGAADNLTPNCAVMPSLTPSVVTLVWIAIGVGSLSTSFAVTSTFGSPVEETRKTAEPFVESASSAALIVTFWNVPKLAGVKVKVAPPLTDRSVSPDNRATFTVTLLVGADESLTPNCAEPPSLTFSVATLVWMTGPPPPPPHDTPLSVIPVGAGWLPDQLALNPNVTLPPV